MYVKYVELKKMKGVTDYRVSVDTGIPRSTFSEWKTGRSKPKFAKLLVLAKYFGVPVDYFADEDMGNITSQKGGLHN